MFGSGQDPPKRGKPSGPSGMNMLLNRSEPGFLGRQKLVRIGSAEARVDQNRDPAQTEKRIKL